MTDMDCSCREKAAACYCRLTRKALSGGILALHLGVGQALYFLYMPVYGACSSKFREFVPALSKCDNLFIASPEVGTSRIWQGYGTTRGSFSPAGTVGCMWPTHHAERRFAARARRRR